MARVHRDRTPPEVVLPCRDLDAQVAFFVERCGMRVESVLPADDPREVVVSGSGLRLRLERSDAGGGGVRLRLPASDGVVGAEPGQSMRAPDGVVVEWCGPATADLPIPEPVLPKSVLHTPAPVGGRRGDWVEGRAGMLYRDLIPGRLGGFLIASHIRIPDAGPVADSVHFHAVLFQVIHCVAGEVRLVYEDQGEPFWLRAGDCVLQPPGIRHRVLECGAGLEVIEVGCPAEHPTHIDHSLELPTETVDVTRQFDGQPFVRHDGEAATWQAWPRGGPDFECQETAVAAATSGAGSVRIVRSRAARAACPFAADPRSVALWFVVAGRAEFSPETGDSIALETDDALVIPPRLAGSLYAATTDFELLEVAVNVG